jgi:bifunctional DNA-binding transcriptional regulator/antitoxin component of YhaV-PrlF toxin-antitoxin module
MIPLMLRLAAGLSPDERIEFDSIALAINVVRLLAPSRRDELRREIRRVTRDVLEHLVADDAIEREHARACRYSDELP